MIYMSITANIMPARTTYERIFETDASNRAFCFPKYSIYKDDTLGRHNDAKGRVMAEIDLLEAGKTGDIVMDKITRRYMNLDDLKSAREIRDRLAVLREKQKQECQD